MARMVATKAALSIRVDALSDSDGKSESDAPSIGLAHRAKLESKLRSLEYEKDASGVRRFAGNGKQQQRFDMSGDTKTYNTQADFVSTQRDDPMETAVKAVLDVKEEKRKAKEERKAKKQAEKSKDTDADGDVTMGGVDSNDKKEKKRKRRESEAVVEVPKQVCCMICCSNLHLMFYRRLRKKEKQERRLRRRRRQQSRRAVTHRRRKRRSLRSRAPRNYLVVSTF